MLKAEALNIFCHRRQTIDDDRQHIMTIAEPEMQFEGSAKNTYSTDLREYRVSQNSDCIADFLDGLKF